MEKQQSATTVRVLLCLLFLIGFLILTGCSGGSGSSETSGGQVEPELAGRSTKCTNGTWEISSPAEHGMDEALLDKVRQYAFGDGRNTQGVVVVRNGVIVEEWYADWADSESCATSWSMAKSFASTLIGIAIDQGDIGSLDDLISDYLTQWQDTDKEDITLRSVLEMRSGLNDVGNLYYQFDQLAASLARGETPNQQGIQFKYVNADSMLLTGVLEAATGQATGDYAKEILFDPIGMHADWWTDGAGNELTYCCIDATSREFARLGILFAAGGTWDENQVVSSRWTDESTETVSGWGTGGYAMQWWTYPDQDLKIYSANGRHGQYIYVIPELNIVVVRSGIYHRSGSGYARTGDAYHHTLPPETWNSTYFLGLILDSVID